jgi:hypothetical protein
VEGENARRKAYFFSLSDGTIVFNITYTDSSIVHKAGISIAKGGGGAVVKKAVLLKMTVPDVPGPTKPAQGTP